MEENTKQGFKGFDKDLKCQGFQYEIGKEYIHTGQLKCCPDPDELKKGMGGFHFCENPLDVFSYYPPENNRFSEVFGCDQFAQNGGDSKIATTHIKIVAEINIRSLIHSGITFIFNKIKKIGYSAHAATTGDYAHAATTGDYAHAATTGHRSHAATTGFQSHAATTGLQAHAATTGYQAHAATTGDSAHAATTGDYAHAATTGHQAYAATTGYQAHAATTGDQSISCALGRKSAAKAQKGCWIVLAEYDDKNNIKWVKSIKVDGKKIKEDTFYMLKSGKFILAR